MAYVSPSITASSGTFAQLQAEGWTGHVDRLIAANSFTARQTSLIRAVAKGLTFATMTPIGITDAISSFLRGAPIATAEIKANLLDYSTAHKAILAALEEVCVLVDANPGTLVTDAAPNGLYARTRRTQP